MAERDGDDSTTARLLIRRSHYQLPRSRLDFLMPINQPPTAPPAQ
ncbi:hypothetical protein ABZ814_25830 [Micromonospora musae]